MRRRPHAARVARERAASAGWLGSAARAIEGGACGAGQRSAASAIGERGGQRRQERRGHGSRCAQGATPLRRSAGAPRRAGRHGTATAWRRDRGRPDGAAPPTAAARGVERARRRELLRTHARAPLFSFFERASRSASSRFSAACRSLSACAPRPGGRRVEPVEFGVEVSGLLGRRPPRRRERAHTRRRNADAPGGAASSSLLRLCLSARVPADPAARAQRDRAGATRREREGGRAAALPRVPPPTAARSDAAGAQPLWCALSHARIAISSA